MQLEITETHAAATPRAAFLNVSWGAIFAGLAVGMASNMLLMMLGTATGLSLFDLGEPGPEQRFPLIAALWNTASMIIAAFVGGYIAARASGLKRSFDGVLHAAAAWGMTLLLSAFLASSVTTATFDVIFPALRSSNAQDSAQLIRNLDRGNLQEAASTDGRAAAQQTLRTATLVSIRLTASVTLSLISAVGGGIAGVHGSRRVLHRRITHLA